MSTSESESPKQEGENDDSLEGLLRLHEAQQRTLLKRWDIEWKVNLSLWAGVVALTYWLRPVSVSFGWCLVFYLGIWSAYAFLWTPWNWQANEKDKVWSAFYRDRSEHILGLRDEPPSRPTVPKWSRLPRDRSRLTQVLVLLFIIAACLYWLHPASDPDARAGKPSQDAASRTPETRPALAQDNNVQGSMGASNAFHDRESFPVTTGIAIAAVFVASFSLGWNVYRDVIDKGRLRLHCYIGNDIAPGQPPDDTHYLFFSVTNVGRRPIMVTHVGGSTTTKPFFILPQNLPRMLQPGEYLVEQTFELERLNDELRSLWVTDSLGREYKAPAKLLRKLITQAKKLLQEGAQPKPT